MGFGDFVYNPTQKYEKLGPEHFTGYVMFVEHPNDNMTEIDLTTKKKVTFINRTFVLVQVVFLLVKFNINR